ncbi:unnamed protein product [Nesidiocoris tenuis]|uniref:VHS domain-containing protein n=1 Tax=Nesidiocoris tenuis TaxID=355587 RepID=A0A6H5FWW8_9HEMI|nr:unnamed protein product [Nesidiocoris tenuis]
MSQSERESARKLSITNNNYLLSPSKSTFFQIQVQGICCTSFRSPRHNLNISHLRVYSMFATRRVRNLVLTQSQGRERCHGWYAGEKVKLLDACVSNCGKNFLLEVSSREFDTEMKKVVRKWSPTTPVGLKLRTLMKKWSDAEFKTDPQLNLLTSMYSRMKNDGIDVSINSDPTTSSSRMNDRLVPNLVKVNLDHKLSSESEKKGVQFNETVEVKSVSRDKAAEIDEGKIDRVLHLLHEADPNDDSHDPPELGPLEEDVMEMGPLIDAELEKVDRKHAQLSEISSSLVEAMNMYHSLLREPVVGAPMKGALPPSGPAMYHGGHLPPQGGPGLVMSHPAMGHPPPPHMMAPPMGPMYATLPRPSMDYEYASQPPPPGASGMYHLQQIPSHPHPLPGGGPPPNAAPAHFYQPPPPSN